MLSGVASATRTGAEWEERGGDFEENRPQLLGLLGDQGSIPGAQKTTQASWVTDMGQSLCPSLARPCGLPWNVPDRDQFCTPASSAPPPH